MDEKKYHIPTVTLIKEGGGEYEFLSLIGTIELASWKNFQIKSGTHATYKDNEDDKKITLHIGGDEVVENPVITKEHVAAYEYVLKYQENIKDAMLNALFAAYPDLQEQYGFDEEEAKAWIPVIDSHESFERLIEPSSVYILNIHKEGVAYVGFSFLCSWDDEHGLGIMTHKDRVVEMEGTDAAFLTWIAERDLNPEEANAGIDDPLPGENDTQKQVKKTKPWWKFW